SPLFYFVVLCLFACPSVIVSTVFVFENLNKYTLNKKKKLYSEYLYRVYVMLCYVILCLLCYAMVGCCAVPCPKNFSAQSDPVSSCASDNRRLITCNLLTKTKTKNITSKSFC